MLRSRSIRIDFECSFPTDYTLSLENGITPLVSSLAVDLGLNVGKFDVSLGLLLKNIKKITN